MCGVGAQVVPTGGAWREKGMKGIRIFTWASAFLPRAAVEVARHLPPLWSFFTCGGGQDNF